MTVLSRLSACSDASIVAPSSRASFHGAVSALGMREDQFIDEFGRVVLLRGVNLGGSSKLPSKYHQEQVTDEKTANQKFFDDAPNVSFVNRPFPLDEADLHFQRLQRWGFNFLRLIITWEAVEHAGPGLYDTEYLEFLKQLVQKAQEYNLLVYIDPHQDVWSRWTGGDGAPFWTLDAIGLNPRNFEATKAAMCMETYGVKAKEYPLMIWPTNYFKFACATMFTLFWAGSKLAPSCRVNGVPVQEYLQSHYINAMKEVAKTLAGMRNLVGFGTMNEPSAGFIGLKDLTKHFHKQELKYGLAPTPFQGMCLADGLPQVIEEWSNGINQYIFQRPDAHKLIDPKGVRAWKDGFECVWMAEGVWKKDYDGKPVLVRNDHFAYLDFGRDCYVPFATTFAHELRTCIPDCFLFAEMPPLEFAQSEFPDIDPKVLPLAVNATHWYDGVTLFLQAWYPYFSFDLASGLPVFGRNNVKKLHERQLRHIAEIGHNQMHRAPTLIGETGIPFNMHHGRAYLDGNYRDQIEALDHTISCLEANVLSYALWCYTSDNNNAYGDLWNLEDLSLVSTDNAFCNQEHQLDVTARARDAFCRVAAVKIAGIPQKSSFSLAERTFELIFNCQAPSKQKMDIQEPTEVHVPHLHFPKGYLVQVSDGQFEVQTREGYDLVLFRHDNSKNNHLHSLRISPKDPERMTPYKQWVQMRTRREYAVVGGACVALLVFLIASLV